MPFIRYNRDKRGFESTYVMHVYRTSPAGPSRTRVLYLFRSPAHVRVGRRPLDGEVMEALEHTHPDLTFDWSALQRDSVMVRAEPRETPRDRRREMRPASRPAPAPPPAPPRAPSPPPAPVQDDGSVLAATLGAAEAARLRQRFDEVVQRVTRRARTPEERDRLLEQARRLNPGAWPDQAAIREQATRVEGEWNALLSQLPSRRRGRRAGRRRPAEAIMGADASATPGSDDAYVDSSTRPSGDPDDGGGLGAADAAPEPDHLPDDD